MRLSGSFDFSPCRRRSAICLSSSFALLYPASPSARFIFAMRISFCFTLSKAMTLSNSIRSTSLKSSGSGMSFRRDFSL